MHRRDLLEKLVVVVLVVTVVMVVVVVVAHALVHRDIPVVLVLAHPISRPA